MNIPYYDCLGENYGKIGGTCHFFSIDGKNIVIDFGIGQTKDDIGRKLRYLPHGDDFLSTQFIDLIIVTHAHDDHIGGIPRLVSQHPEAQVVISGHAFDIADVAFDDALKIMQEEGNEFFRYRDVERFFTNKNLHIIEQDEAAANGWLRLWQGWEGWKIGLYPSGHYIGAFSVYMISPSGKKIMLTGDTSSQDQRSVPGVMLPKNGFFTGDFLGGDITMVAEGTNAARKKQKTREQIEKELVSFVEKVRRKNGSILFSCFGRQRAAELALTLIDLGYGVHIDGIARQMAAIEAPSLLNLAETGKVVFITGSRMETEVHRRRVAKGTVHCCGHEPPIIISPSASLEGGHSVGHATRILPFRNNGAGYVGHNFPDTPAYEIFHLRKRRVTLDVFGQSSRVDVNCRIGSFDLTAHDYQEDIIERVRLVEPKKLIVHHCPGFDEFHILHEEIIRNIPDPPKEIYYAPLVRKVEI